MLYFSLYSNFAKIFVDPKYKSEGQRAEYIRAVYSFIFFFVFF